MAILELNTAAVYRPSALRKAWCELSGGHDNAVFEARDCKGTRAIRLLCHRCGKLTKWYNVTRAEDPSHG